MTEQRTVGPRRAAIYARVSTTEQAEKGTSLEIQVEQCRAFIAEQGWTVVGEYIDEGVSGTKAKRPRLDAMMVEATGGNIDAVVVAKLDRFARSMNHLSTMVAELDEHGVRFVTVDGKFETATAQGRLMRNILGSFAEFERDMIIERTSSGLRKVAAGGNWPGGPPPFGFRIERADGARARLALDDAEAETLRLVVSLIVDEGCTAYEAAARLNALGYLPRRARQWTHNMLRDLLKRLPLSGQWTYAKPRSRTKAANGEPLLVSVPAIITPARHNDLRAALARTSTGSGATDKRHDYLLSSRLVGSCGGRFHGVYRVDRDLRQYQCSNARTEAYERCTDHRLMSDAIEDQVWEAVTDVLSQPERLLDLAEGYLGMRSEQLGTERETVESLDSKIEKLEKARNQTLVGYAKAGLDPAAVKEASAALQSEIDAAKRHRSQVTAWHSQTLAKSERMRRLWELADIAHRHLGTMGTKQRAQVLDLLDVQVSVLDWTVCTECNGKRRIKGGNGVRCPGCHGIGHVPTIRIEGTVWDHTADALTCDDADIAVGQQLREVPRHLAPHRRRSDPAAWPARTSRDRAG